MSASLVRGLHVFTRARDREHFERVDDGAVRQENGRVAEVGRFDDLARRYPTLPVIGNGRQVVLPGFVDAHHHVGLTPLQLGSPDMPLELWFITRLVARRIDPYLDTLYSAFEQIASGITTVAHLQPAFPGDLAGVETAANAIIRAYEDVGMRVSYSYGLRDQNRLVYKDDNEFVASLPADLQGPMSRAYGRFKLTADDYFALFESLFERHKGKDRVRIQLAPANLHWCSDKSLERFRETAERFHVPLHMHLVETAFQREYARRRTGGGTAVDLLDKMGLLGPSMTLGHGVWLSERDLDRVAETGTCICHNCSSNFRLRSGVAPLNAFEKRGITTAIGIDEAGINDDRDMLQEMRLVLRAHRVPGMEDLDVPTVPQVVRMATAGGAATTGFAGEIGTLEPGRACDLVMIDWDKVALPYLDPLTGPLEAVVQRAKTSAVDLVMIGGEIVYRDGRFTRIDRDAVLKEIHASLAKPFADDELERRALSKAVLPHVRKLYAGYTDLGAVTPFYRTSAR